MDLSAFLPIILLTVVVLAIIFGVLKWVNR